MRGSTRESFTALEVDIERLIRFKVMWTVTLTTSQHLDQRFDIIEQDFNTIEGRFTIINK